MTQQLVANIGAAKESTSIKTPPLHAYIVEQLTLTAENRVPFTSARFTLIEAAS